MMNRGTGFIALTLAGHVPARVGLREPPVSHPKPPGEPPQARRLAAPQPLQVSAEHLFHPRVVPHDQA
jgi:hypothetical protein